MLTVIKIITKVILISMRLIIVMVDRGVSPGNWRVLYDVRMSIYI